MSKPVQPLQHLTQAIRRLAERHPAVVWLPSAVWFFTAEAARVDLGALVGLLVLLIAPASCARNRINSNAGLEKLRVLNSTYLDAKVRDEVAFKAGRVFEREFLDVLGEDAARGYSGLTAQARRSNGFRD